MWIKYVYDQTLISSKPVKPSDPCVNNDQWDLKWISFDHS